MLLAHSVVFKVAFFLANRWLVVGGVLGVCCYIVGSCCVRVSCKLLSAPKLVLQGPSVMIFSSVPSQA